MAAPDFVKGSSAYKRSSVIHESTLVPISFVLVLIFGSFWLTQIYVQGNDNSKAIEKLLQHQEKVDRRMYLIMGALKVKDGPNE